MRHRLLYLRNPCRADWSDITAVKKIHLFERLASYGFLDSNIMEGWYPIAIGLEAVASGFFVSFFVASKKEREARQKFNNQRSLRAKSNKEYTPDQVRSDVS